MKNFWHNVAKPIIALAPMEGYTDSAFRQLAKRGGAAVVYTEFVSADAIGHGAKQVLDNLAFDPNEQPVVCQIFGRDLDMFKLAAREIERRGFSGIDLNCGCPARSVVGHGAGVALLRDPEYIRRLVVTLLENTTLPVSIKVRTSIRKERKEVAPGIAERYTALDMIEAIHDLPVAAIMVHGRSFEAGHAGAVDTGMIKAVKERFSGLVIANGGVRTPEDAARLLEQTGADGVAIARGAVGQPWIFKQVKDYLTNGGFEPETFEQIKMTIIEHATVALKTKGPRGLIELRKHLVGYIKGFAGASALRQQLVQVTTLDDIEQALAGF